MATLASLPAIVTITGASLGYQEQAGVGSKCTRDVYLGSALIVATNSIIVPFITSGVDLRGYQGYLADGVTVVPLLSINNAQNITIGGGNVPGIGLISFGPTATPSFSAIPLSHYNQTWGGAYFVESSDYSQDMPAITTDFPNNLHIGNNGVVYAGANQTNHNYFDVQAGKSQFWTEATVTVMGLTSSVLHVRPGTATYPPVISVGGAAFDDYTDTASAGTANAEEDLYTHTLLANTLANNGDKVISTECISIVGNATSSRQIKLVSFGTTTFDSGGVISAGAVVLEVEQTIIRESSTVVRVMSRALPAAWGAPQYTRITGLTLSADNILKTRVNPKANGAGSAAAGDIIDKLKSIRYLPAAGVLTFPLSLLPIAWFKADAGTYQTAGGTPATLDSQSVGSVLDQGLQSHNLAQATSGKRPLLRTGANGINSLNALSFDGVDDFLNINFTWAQPNVFYMVVKPLTAIAGTSGQAYFEGSSSGNCQITNSFGNANLYSGNNVTGVALTQNTVYLLKVVNKGVGSFVAKRTGGVTTSGTPADGGAAAASGITLASKADGTGNMNMLLGEFIAFTAELTGGQETSLISYLDRWGY